MTNEYTKDNPKTITDPQELIDFLGQHKAVAQLERKDGHRDYIERYFLSDRTLCTECHITGNPRPIGNRLSMILLFDRKSIWRCWTELEANEIAGDINWLPDHMKVGTDIKRTEEGEE